MDRHPAGPTPRIVVQRTAALWLLCGAVGCGASVDDPAPMTDAGPRTVLWSGSTGCDAIAVDADAVYFTGDGELRRMAKDGSDQTALASDAYACDLAVDDDSVYFVNTGTVSAPGTALVRVAKAGGAAFDLLADLLLPERLAMSSTRVFATTSPATGRGIVAVEKAGGVPAVISSTYAFDLVADDSDVIWSERRAAARC